MNSAFINDLLVGLKAGTIVPYLGCGALNGSQNVETGAAIPADSDSLIYAINDGKPMAPRLMYEFPRAAMNIELKRGRPTILRKLQQIYGETKWTRAPLHDFIKSLRPAYVIDVNRDMQLQHSYSDVPHILISGMARLGETQFRYRLYHYDGTDYRQISNEEVTPGLPILFKCLGSPMPSADFIASDADFVDYITELMGGFAIPDFLKDYRKDKQYLMLGLPLNRDTERMIMADVTYDCAPKRGWAFIPEPTKKEEKYCSRFGIEIVTASVEDFLAMAAPLAEETAA